jgi:transcriptional regulator GlxA family with amidase domain
MCNPTMHSVWFLLFDEFPIFDGCGPLKVFFMANQERVSAGREFYCRTSLLGKEARPYFSSVGAELSTQALPEMLDALVDRVLISGGLDAFNTPKSSHLIRWLQESAPRIARLTCVHTGAFLLARIGFLGEGHGSGTSVMFNGFTLAFPAIKVGRYAIHVGDRSDRVSAGMAAGIDMFLAMIEADLGQAIAINIANKVIASCKHPTGQSLLNSALLRQPAGDPRIEDLRGFIMANLKAYLTVSILAEQMSMSRRTFARFFVSKTGVTPARAVEQMRIDRACALIEAPDRSIKWIAYTCGFGSSEMMRRAFIRNLHVSPSEYRKRFAVDQTGWVMR